MNQRIRAARQRRRDGERGAILVELTLIVPVLVTIVLGMLEIGMAWSASTVTVSATRQGARVGSHLAQDLSADRQAIQAIEAVFGEDADQVVKIVLFDGTANAGQPPAACVVDGSFTSPGTEDCNVYDGSSVFGHLADNSRWGCTAGTLDRNWCPNTRDQVIRSADALGVYIEFEHEWFTGFFPADSRVLRATTVMRVEPDPNA